MKLSELVNANSISIGWPVHSNRKNQDKWSFLEDLVSFTSIQNNFTADQTKEANRLLLAREKSMTTGIGDGIAIPHATLDFLKEAIGAISVYPEGLAFDAIDDQPVKIVIEILMPKGQFEKHIQTLASITRLMHDKKIRDNILKQKNPSEIWQLIFAYEKELNI